MAKKRGRPRKKDVAAPVVQAPAAKEAVTGTAPGGEFESDALRVNALHAQIETQDKDNLAKAIEIGNALRPIREGLKAGKLGRWMAWAKEKLKFSDATALHYIKVADAHAKGLLAAAKGLTDAYAVLRKAFPTKRRSTGCPGRC